MLTMRLHSLILPWLIQFTSIRASNFVHQFAPLLQLRKMRMVCNHVLHTTVYDQLSKHPSRAKSKVVQNTRSMGWRELDHCFAIKVQDILLNQTLVFGRRSASDTLGLLFAVEDLWRPKFLIVTAYLTTIEFQMNDLISAYRSIIRFESEYERKWSTIF